MYQAKLAEQKAKAEAKAAKRKKKLGFKSAHTLQQGRRLDAVLFCLYHSGEMP